MDDKKESLIEAIKLLQEARSALRNGGASDFASHVRDIIDVIMEYDGISWEDLE